MKCPVCRADNVTGPQCRRCRADLSTLLALEEQRRRALVEASRAAAAGRWPRAAALAEGADALRSDAESRRLLAAAHLMQRHFARAWECYRSASSLSAGRESG
jgi:hypothetical protein